MPPRHQPSLAKREKAARRSLGEGGRCKPPRATAGKPALKTSTKRRRPVGWVERSETHHASQDDKVTGAMGFTSFYPSYALKLFAGGEEAKELFASLARELASIVNQKS